MNEFICCNPCFDSFNSAIKFRQTLIENQRVLTNVLNKENEILIEEYLSQEEVPQDDIHEEEDMLVEALESEVDDSFDITDNFEDSHTNQQRKKYPRKKLKDPINCPKCDRKFFYKAYFQFHYKDVHREDREEICQYCGKVFKNSRRLNSHLVVHQRNNSDKRHKCDVCDKQFHFSGDLSRHKRVS